eukprot:847828-Amorphochlora_amoeboformis.AAC.1
MYVVNSKKLGSQAYLMPAASLKLDGQREAFGRGMGRGWQLRRVVSETHLVRHRWAELRNVTDSVLLGRRLKVNDITSI